MMPQHQYVSTSSNIVKPVYNGHPLDLKKVCSKGGCYNQGVPIDCFQIWKNGTQAGCCRQVAIVQRWLLAQV